MSTVPGKDLDMIVTFFMLVAAFVLALLLLPLIVAGLKVLVVLGVFMAIRAMGIFGEWMRS